MKDAASFELRPATGSADIEAARSLFREYQKAIGVDLCFQDFEQELAYLPGEYAAPSGSMKEATALYRSLGFVPIEAYYSNPVAGTLYFELSI